MLSQGAAARHILRRVRGVTPVPFHYHDFGTLAVIGRNAAVANIFGGAFTGFFAWLLWLGVHIFSLIGFRNRLVVLIDWAWGYVFWESGVRLIVLQDTVRGAPTLSSEVPGASTVSTATEAGTMAESVRQGSDGVRQVLGG